MRELLETIRSKVKEIRPEGEEPGCFPPGMLLGASWNRSVIYEVGEAVAREAMACLLYTSGIVELDETAVIEEIHAVGGETDFIDWKPNEEQKKAAEHLFTALEPQKDKTEKLPVLKMKASDFDITVHRTPKPDPNAVSLVESLSDEELVYLCTGEFIGEGSKNVIGDAAITVVGAAGETTGRFSDRGVSNLVMADGPSGLRLSRRYGVDAKGAYPCLLYTTRCV